MTWSKDRDEIKLRYSYLWIYAQEFLNEDFIWIQEHNSGWTFSYVDKNKECK